MRQGWMLDKLGVHVNKQLAGTDEAKDPREALKPASALPTANYYKGNCSRPPYFEIDMAVHCIPYRTSSVDRQLDWLPSRFPSLSDVISIAANSLLTKERSKL